MNKLWLIALLIMTLVQSREVRAEKIKFPQAELARETTHPVFDEKNMVLDRNVITKGRFELGPYIGASLNEPFNSGQQLGGLIGYHFTDTHGLNLAYSYIPQNLTSYTGQLKAKFPSLGNLENAPFMKSFFLANYEWTSHYGKVSITKQYVMNLSLAFDLGLAFVGVGDKSYPGLSMGVAHKFYLTRDLAIRFDLRVLAHNGPNILAEKQPNVLSNSTGPVSASNFKEQLLFPMSLSAGLIYLL